MMVWGMYLAWLLSARPASILCGLHRLRRRPVSLRLMIQRGLVERIVTLPRDAILLMLGVALVLEKPRWSPSAPIGARALAALQARCGSARFFVDVARL